ncbi:MAG: LuxR C-terminal-related transcriptional regulator [Tannerellaceae bacterium]|nr:LuxR C-terminal-related transcriptional regulator [Tannerellaceae bacterium]
MKAINKHFFIQNDPDKLNETPSLFIQHCSMFSSITAENLYVWDILQSQFCYIKADNLLLGSFSVEDAIREGCDFYLKIVYPDDLSLCREMGNTILQYLKKFKEKREEIDYFTFTFRLQHNFLSSSSRFLQQMVSSRIKPMWEGDKLRYFICSVGNSTIREAGNLRMYNRDRLTYEEYNFICKRWKQQRKMTLTKRESVILMLAQQGKNYREIAYDLCKGHNTIRNQIKSLFSKLKVHSMQEALESAHNHCIIYLNEKL